MNFRAVFRLVSCVLLVMGLAQGVCAALAVPLGDAPATRDAFALAALAPLLAGACGLLLTRGGAGGLRPRDGFGVVVLGWLFAALAGALPYLFTGAAPTFAAAFFDSMSGLTTTGATTMPDVEALPRALVLWAAATQFIGGLGVLVLMVALLPLIGNGGMSLFRAEATGPVKNRLTPRIATTAKILWGVYCGLTLCETLLLRLAGVSWFESVCHAFSSMSSGGFSTRNAGVAGFHSPLVEAVVIVFMLLSGVNFSLMFRALRGDLRGAWRDSELRFYVCVWLALCGLFTAGLFLSSASSLAASARAAFFTVTSFLTTTGFTASDYNAWPNFLRFPLFLLLFLGACAGSTSGGVKMVRVLAALRFAANEIRRWVRPQAVVPVKINETPLDAAVLHNILGFIVLYVLAFAAGALAMSFFYPDLFSAAGTAASMLSNTGPGFNATGPGQNFSTLPGAGQVFLAFLMMLGRLELYTVLALFTPSFWRR
ncbi:MAG: TrkH family potassium uptake protein [Kiritimatiellaeota bacterium]|nr:TrkH family potassium uptake protein [Kiritimatiellota bacterium]